MASRYGEKAKQKVARAMHERKRGTLKSGSGKTVKSRKQAIAIGLSEARKAGGKAPPARKKKSSKKKSSKKKSSKKKSSKKKSSKKKSTRKTSSRARRKTSR